MKKLKDKKLLPENSYSVFLQAKKKFELFAHRKRHSERVPGMMENKR